MPAASPMRSGCKVRAGMDSDSFAAADRPARSRQRGGAA
jgi:hypothetical protein